MKKYSDFMDEISGDDLYDRLIGHGFFPEKLPPVLDATSFLILCKISNPGFEKKSYDYIRFDSMRNINTPRALGIPTPMAYEKLCSVLKANWGNIQQHFHTHTDSQNHLISRNHLQLHKYKDVLFEMNYDDWRSGGSPKDDLPLGMRFIVKADISSCFPSIYTHSIPWALVGKSVSKEKRSEKKWFNKIDKACQNLKDRETHGLLIGPHASNLISEIILTVVDHILYDKGWRYIRNIDDYTCFVESREKADCFITDLIDELRKFDLTLNYRKTVIKSLPNISLEMWVRKLNSFSLLTSYGKVDYKQARAFFDLAIELMYTNGGNASVLNYAIKVLAGQKMTDNAKVYSWKTGMQLALIYPYLIPLMDNYVFSAYGVDKDAIDMFANKDFDDGIKTRNFEECCYAIYYALKYDFNIRKLDATDMVGINSCLLMLLTYLYYKKYGDVTSIEIMKKHAKSLVAKDLDRNWLFVYEVLEEVDLSDDWKVLKRKEISFLKPEFQY